MFPGPTDLLLIGCSIELILIPSKSNTSTPRTNLQTSWPKGNFTRDVWNHLLTLFNISHFSSTSCIAAMAKRAQQDSGEGRVTAKSRRWWTWPQERLRSCLLQPHQTQGRLCMNLFLTIERWNPLKRQDQTMHKIMVYPGLLNCGKVEMESTIDLGNLIKIL